MQIVQMSFRNRDQKQSSYGFESKQINYRYKEATQQIEIKWKLSFLSIEFVKVHHQQ